MKTHLLACAAVFVVLGSVAALAAVDSKSDWQFSERPTQDGEGA